MTNFSPEVVKDLSCRLNWVASNLMLARDLLSQVANDSVGVENGNILIAAQNIVSQCGLVVDRTSDQLSGETICPVGGAGDWLPHLEEAISSAPID